LEHIANIVAFVKWKMGQIISPQFLISIVSPELSQGNKEGVGDILFRSS
jgi:hypothetical protein